MAVKGSHYLMNRNCFLLKNSTKQYGKPATEFEISLSELTSAACRREIPVSRFASKYVFKAVPRSCQEEVIASHCVVLSTTCGVLSCPSESGWCNPRSHVLSVGPWLDTTDVLNLHDKPLERVKDGTGVTSGCNSVDVTAPPGVPRSQLCSPCSVPRSRLPLREPP